MVISYLCERACFSELSEKRVFLSKGKEIVYNELKAQSYLKSGHGLSAQKMKMIYALRTRALPLKCNSPSQHKDRFCLHKDCLEEDREGHVYFCQFLTNGNEVTQKSSEYNEIYANNVETQIRIIDRFSEMYWRRNSLLPSQHREGPVAPLGAKPSGSLETRKKSDKTQTSLTKLSQGV